MTTLRSEAAPPLFAPRRVRLLYLVHAVALVLVGVAALGTSNTGDFSEQTNWTALAILGLLGGGLASTGAVLTGRREVGRRQAKLARTIAGAFERASTPDTADASRFATPPMSHYHREDCPMVRGKGPVAASIAQHQRAERTPCAVCEP